LKFNIRRLSLLPAADDAAGKAYQPNFSGRKSTGNGLKFHAFFIESTTPKVGCYLLV
jgi:hypothetical protein